ncbi:MAG: ceramidase domain-containing protein [Pseudomonadota bacterium]
MSTQGKQQILVGISLLLVTVLFLAPRIPQDPSYHLFADQTARFSIPNALDVASNFLFAWVGCLGLIKLRNRQLKLNDKPRAAYPLFFASLMLVAFGSGYYHWSPDNQSLVWDRLPMTLAFMSFFSILLAERVSQNFGNRIFPVLIVAGIISVLYWHWSESSGSGDLRPYILVQFLPILLTPLILVMFPSRFTKTSYLWWFLGWYLAAKGLELLDHTIYEWLSISGHSLKHIAAGIGCLIYLRHLQLREKIPA